MVEEEEVAELSRSLSLISGTRLSSLPESYHRVLINNPGFSELTTTPRALVGGPLKLTLIFLIISPFNAPPHCNLAQLSE